MTTVRAKHEKQLEEEIAEENSNPFSVIGDGIVNGYRYVYQNYLYSSGVLFLSFALWSFYPAFARFRHSHWMRYRGTQQVLRRGFFATEHIPKWNKKYLDRLVVPILPSRQVKVESPKESSSDELVAQSNATPANALDTYAGGNPFQKLEISLRQSHRLRFTKGEGLKFAKDLSVALEAMNEAYFRPNSFTSTPNPELPPREELQSVLEECLKTNHTVVVLKETSKDSKAIPEGFEVWWLSHDEFKRRQFCKLWLMLLGFARCLQDMLDMPEMPEFVQ